LPCILAQRCKSQRTLADKLLVCLISVLEGDELSVSEQDRCTSVDSHQHPLEKRPEERYVQSGYASEENDHPFPGISAHLTYRWLRYWLTRICFQWNTESYKYDSEVQSDHISIVKLGTMNLNSSCWRYSENYCCSFVKCNLYLSEHLV
jgi:hypothetical protein